MDFTDLLYDLMLFIHDNLYFPVRSFMDNQFNIDILDTSFKIGIGQVTFIDTTLDNVIGLAIALMVSITVLLYTIKFIKWIWSFARRLFGGR